MNISVFFHIRLLVEPLPAVLARVRSGVGVDEQVGGESAGSLEGFSTLLAFEDFFHAVDGPVRKGLHEW